MSVEKKCNEENIDLIATPLIAMIGVCLEAQNVLPFDHEICYTDSGNKFQIVLSGEILKELPKGTKYKMKNLSKSIKHLGKALGFVTNDYEMSSNRDQVRYVFQGELV